MLYGNTLNHTSRDGSHRGQRVRMNPDRSPVVYPQATKVGPFAVKITSRMMPRPRRVVK